ncbi:MAG TPA: site-2 protease family protein [Patescibacteria group bacterium]|nr:site-2 protease family protein [Patescibacteria group bacterium]
MIFDERTLSALVAVSIFLVVGFPVHEYAHALTAYRLGDGTAKLFGRLTLNPLAHLDPLGSGILALSALFGGFFIGWAKPTPVNPSMLRHGRWGEALVAVAGPLSNLVLAILAAVVVRALIAAQPEPTPVLEFVRLVTVWFLVINISLFIFNLLPLPPLDGSKVLFAFLPARTVWRVRPLLEQWGFVILLAVMFLPPGDSIGARILLPVISAIFSLLVGA